MKPRLYFNLLTAILFTGLFIRSGEVIGQCVATISSSSSVICGGSIGVYSTFTGSNYKWYKNGTLMSGQTGPSITLAPGSGTASYYCTATISWCSGTRTSNTVLITDNAPVASISPTGPTALCPGSSGVLLTASSGTGFTYQWVRNGSHITGQTSASYTATTVGTYSCRVMKQGCTTMSNNITVTGTPPAPVITSTGNITCSGGAVTLSATSTPSGLFYVWYRNGTSVQGGSTLTPYTATSAGIYKLMVVVNPCQVYSNEVIVADESPIASISGNALICPGSNGTVLTAQTGAGYTYEWYKDGIILEGANSSSYTATVAGSYNSRVTSGTCSKVSNSINVSVVSFDTTLSVAGTACNGGTATLTVSAGASYYIWYRNGTVSSTGSTLNSLNVTTGGEYYVVMPNNGFCTSTSNTVFVPGGAPPSAVLSASGSTSLCAGDSVQISTTNYNGGTYTWYKDDEQFASNNSASQYVSSAGNYTVHVIDNQGGGCAATSDVLQINVHELPEANITGNHYVCSGDSVSLTANSGIGFSYQWQKDGVHLAEETSQTLMVDSPGDYSVIVTSSSGCSTISNNWQVEELASPNVEISGDNFYCIGHAVTLRAISSGDISYQWFKNSAPISNATADSISITEPGDYSVKVTANGCSSTSSLHNVQERLLPLATISGPTFYCEDSNTLLTASAGDGYEYQWIKNDTIISSSTNSTLQVDVPGQYKVQVSLNGCTAISSEHSIEERMIAPVSISGPSDFCQGDSVLLIATSGAGQYQWLRNNVVIDQASSNTYYASQSGSYTVQTVADQCQAVSDVKEVTEQLPPVASIETPSTTVICQDIAIPLQATTGVGYTYQWQKNGEDISGATNSAYQVTSAGSYRILVDKGGCHAFSDSILTTERQLPLVTIDGKKYFCNGDSTKLQIVQISGYSYQWLKNDVALAGETESEFVVDDSALIKVLISDGECSDTTSAAIITELSMPHPIAGLLGDTLLWTGQREFFTVNDTTAADAFIWEVPSIASIIYSDVQQTKAQLSFSQPGNHQVKIFSRNGGCWSPAFEQVIKVEGNLMALTNIPEEVKTSRDKKLPVAEPTIPRSINEIEENQPENVFEGCLGGKYFVGFQLLHDLSNRNTTQDWSVFLQISLLHEDDTLWTKPLQVDITSQTMISTIFHDSAVSCTEDYRFIVRRKYLTGNVPEESVYVNTLLYKKSESNFNPATRASLDCNISSITNSNTISWTYTGDGVQEYDLEWVFIGDHESFPDTLNSEEAFKFREPVGVTIENSTHYKHLVYYPDGKLWYRIRAVGYNPQYPDHRIIGHWSYDSCSVITIANHNPDLNWQEQTVFAEDGKYKKVMNYFDGSLRQRQAQSNLSSEDVTVVGEMLYDFEGRQSVNVLAVPATNTSLRYRSGFNIFQPVDTVVTNRTDSNRRKFHYDNHRATNSVMANSSGAGQYYSPANASNSMHRDFIPDAEGYVYSQTEYLNDGTGRVSRQSGVGEAFAMDGEHPTRYYYGEAAAAELIRLFGSNVGNASHYKKNLVVDGNGQVSVTYVDQEGKTIATALAGDPPSNVDSLTSFKNLLPLQAITVDISSKNKKESGASVTQHKILNESPNTAYTFSYDLAAYGSEVSMFGCKNCSFDLAITISDPDGKLLRLDTIPGNESTDLYSYQRKNITAESCTDPTQMNDVTLHVLFKEIGDYTITKALDIQDLSFDQMQTIVGQESSVQSALTLIRNSYTVNSEDCEICTSGPEADQAIEDAIQEIAQLDCENIYNQIIQYYQDRNSGDTLYTVPQDSIESHELYCKYTLCAKNKDSDIFEKQFSRVNSWSDAVAKGYSNLFSIDPFFQNPSLSGYSHKISMLGKLNNVFVARIGYDTNGDEVEDANTVFEGAITEVIDPLNTDYYINQNGAPDVNGKHLLYLELQNKRNDLGENAYQQKVNEQRWSLYKGFYLEAKRKVKLSAYGNCPKAKEELEINDGLPTNPDSIKVWAEINGVGNEVSPQEIESSFLSIRSACGAAFSPQDSTAIAGHLQNYFNGNRNNFLKLIFIADVGLNSDLIAVQNILNNYDCTVNKVAQVGPLACLNDTTLIISNGIIPFGYSAVETRELMTEDFESTGITAKVTNNGVLRGSEQYRISNFEPSKEPIKTAFDTLKNKMLNKIRKNAQYEIKLKIDGHENLSKQGESKRPRTNMSALVTTYPLPSVQEYNALMAFYDATNGANWNNNDGWRDANPAVVQYVGDWYGVTVDDDGHVIKLELGPYLHGLYVGSVNLSGYLTPQIKDLTHLRVLDISSSKMIGSIPPEIGLISSLEYLDLSANLLGDTIPLEIASLHSLKYLDLRNNQLDKYLPSALAQLMELEYLDVGYNNLIGVIPDEFGNFMSLKYLYLTGNHFTGIIPRSLSNISTLEHLYIGGWYDEKGLTGNLPVEFRNLSNLKTLSITNDSLGGGIPPQYGQLSQLQFLELDGLRLIGSIPPELGNIDSLQQLRLVNNLLSGNIPSTLGNLLNLQGLSLELNQLTGGIPVQLCYLPNLVSLRLTHNQLSGTIPLEIENLDNLYSLRLEENQFSGAIPPSLGNLTNLNDLFLSWNNLTEIIPSSLGKLQNLKMLSLAGNQLGGSIPVELFNLSQLEVLWLQQCNLSGDIPIQIENLKNLYYLMLTDNNFTGSIPVEITTLPQLRYAYLSDNELKGPIPVEFKDANTFIELWIEGNKYSFEEIVPFIQEFGRDRFTYYRQDSVGTQEDHIVQTGNPLVLTATIDRSTNPASLYQWYKYVGGINIPLNSSFSTNNHTLVINNPVLADSGYYYYKIRNPDAPTLELTSRLQKLKVVDGEIVNICLEYDNNNETLQKFAFTVDFNKEIEKCLANAALEDSILTEYAVERLMEDYITEYYNKYRTQCLDKVKEHMNYTFTSKEYHYTLYYYDQAKNLVQTVPPAGVKPLTSQQVTAFLAGDKRDPKHSLVTSYQYTSLNQLLWQQTPDAGESNFYYNKKGQLKLSQNAQQAKDSRYSYTKYDEQGRIFEVGEMETALTIGVLKDSLQKINFPVASADFTLADITRTHYDFPDSIGIVEFPQRYLRTRVSWVEVFEKNTSDTIATYYSYDIHGNVRSLLQRVPGISDKRTDYLYDLVSGKVNYVFYQYKKHDQFAHKYEYDADNRLTDVFTSTDRFIWNREATYHYYKHGPLARVELGAYRSQGLDYYYTLQGWIKGVNQPYADSLMNGYDYNVGKDVFAYALGYYEGDYKAIKGTFTPTDSRDHLWTRLSENMNHNGLFNGNISWMVTDLAKIAEINNDRSKSMQAMLYKYDQLNRITNSRSLTNYSEQNGFALRMLGANPYDETYTYDGNGNILTLDRMNAQGQVMHDYDYYYYKGTNKLRGVLPIVRDTTYSAAINSNNKLYRDILVQGAARPQVGTPAELRATRDITFNNNFEAEEGNDFAAYIPEDGPFIYDAIGNLIADEEEGSKISWTPYGKVREVKTKNDSVVVKFRYDATGNRIEKRVEKYDTVMVTRYMRDANGSVMTIYKDTTVLEQPIYGSSRLGMKLQEVREGTQSLGTRSYELTNHLGNVLTTISDNINMQADSAWTNVVSTNDYYPFGLDMKERSWSDSTLLQSRYGFNGKEKDTNGEWGSTTYDYGFRIYDPSIGKFLSVDPLTQEYPWYTPYQFAGNNPVKFIDMDGLEPLDPQEVDNSAQTLIIIVQGIGGEPAKGRTQAKNYPPDTPMGLDTQGLGQFQSVKNKSLHIMTFASAQGEQTKDDIELSIMRFAAITEGKGKVVAIGHSQGADNAVEVLQKKRAFVDLLITIDIMDSRLGYNDSDNVFGNVLNVINYHQTGEFFKGATIDSWDIEEGTNVVNKEVKGANHRSIDNYILPILGEDVRNFIQGLDFMKITKERKIKESPKPKEPTIVDTIKEKTF